MTKKKRKNVAWYILFTLPLLIIFCITVIIPFFVGIKYSFYRWDGLSLNPKVFVGLDNYKKIFSDGRFLSTVSHTVVFTVIAVIVINVLGLIFALIVTTKLKVRNVLRTMVFAPYLIGGLILGYIWKFILGDAFTTIGNLIGFDNVFFNWLLDPKFALYGMILVSTWQMAGYIMIIYITGIQAIPEDVLEAASIDGSNYWQKLFKVKFPLLMPSFTISIFMTLSNCFKIFDVNFSLTGGGPSNATEMFAMNIYNEIYSLNNFGYGQAKAIVFFLIVAVITLTQVFITKRKEVSM